MKFNIIKKGDSSGFKGLGWNSEELSAVEERILKLRKDQVAALLFLVGIRFSKEDIEEVVDEILEHGHESINLGILTEEADSKDNLLWWIDYFARHKN